jgi:hypothetical protein
MPTLMSGNGNVPVVMIAESVGDDPWFIDMRN